ncbi:complement C1q-like protein 2 isoform X1 [Dicentrarchus labrax]|uniref:C1q domain-containing protein n=1 Tax=Dicentrarchus labrax TaxID=13489 RepID=A0A8P4G7X9_DICLA|nr:complement C1q-like protein 2 isoform X1 [Dicentrarchus labrax]
MKITVIFPLLLLVCSGSTDQNKQIAKQQPFPQDINAVLREMAVTLTQQKFEMRLLQRENKEHAAKLERQETELKKQETELKKQETELKKQETEVDKLKQQLKVGQVAFSASLLDTGHGDVGPFPTYTTLTFKHVPTNIGKAYNPHTGIFTAPVRGAYHFEWYIGTHGGAQPSGAVLVKNSEHIFIAWEHQPSHYGSSANGVTLLLEVGDVVFLRLWVNTKVFDNSNHHTTFSGHLLFTM